MKGFTKLVEDTCAAAMIEAGFERITKATFNWMATAPRIGWVGLNRGTKSSGSVVVSPFIGLHCVQLEQFVKKVRGEKYRRGDLASFAFALGQMPGYEASSDTPANFVFAPGPEPKRQARQLAECVKEYALPFFARFRSIGDVLEQIRSLPGKQGYVEDLTAALFLAGQREEALRHAKEWDIKAQSEDPLMRDDLLKFLKPFIALVDNSVNPIVHSS